MKGVIHTRTREYRHTAYHQTETVWTKIAMADELEEEGSFHGPHNILI
jgi:hypothetical protein